MRLPDDELQLHAAGPRPGHPAHRQRRLPERAHGGQLHGRRHRPRRHRAARRLHRRLDGRGRAIAGSSTACGRQTCTTRASGTTRTRTTRPRWRATRSSTCFWNSPTRSAAAGGAAPTPSGRTTCCCGTAPSPRPRATPAATASACTWMAHRVSGRRMNNVSVVGSAFGFVTIQNRPAAHSGHEPLGHEPLLPRRHAAGDE